MGPSEDLVRKVKNFLRQWLGQMAIPEDEDGLVNFVKDILEPKLLHFEKLLDEYNLDRYPEKEVVNAARDLFNDVLSQKRDNVALLTRLTAKQDEILNCSEDMEDIETFFKSQREIFDAARKLQRDLENEHDYFLSDTVAKAKIEELSSILSLVKPYAKIKDLGDIMQTIRSAYGVLLNNKKKQVEGIINQYALDVHSIEIKNDKILVEIENADQRYAEYKQRVLSMTSLTSLDALITQLNSFKDQVILQIDTTLHSINEGSGQYSSPRKIIQIRRSEAFPVKRLATKLEVDDYIESVRKRLYESLEANDEVQIN